MNRFKFFSILCAFVLVLGGLFGCSNASPSGESSDNGGTEEAKDPKDFKGELDIWTFFGGVKEMAKSFEEKYPNVKVNVSVFPGDKYQTKLTTAIQTRTDIPDIFDLEKNYIGKFINQDFLANLSEMGAEKLLKDYVPYVKELGIAEDGTVRAVADTASPGAFWYNRNLAKKYLGTEDPQEISKMVESWDKIVKIGEKVNKESNGKVHLLSHFGDVYHVEKHHQDPWVQDGKLTIDPNWEEIINNMRRVRESGTDAKLPYMSPGWADALNEGGVVMMAMPSWAGFMVSDENGEAAGKYGIAQTPKGFYMGGTYRAIYEGSENKQLAYEFIKYIASNEWQTENLKETGNMPAIKSLYSELEDSYKNKWFGDQNVLKVYYDLLMDIPPAEPTKYGPDITNLFYEAASDGIENGKSNEEIISRFKGDVQNAYPEIEVE